MKINTLGFLKYSIEELGTTYLYIIIEEPKKNDQMFSFLQKFYGLDEDLK